MSTSKHEWIDPECFGGAWLIDIYIDRVMGRHDGPIDLGMGRHDGSIDREVETRD